MTDRDLFLAALDIPDPAARERFLAGRCDADGRYRIDRLLAAHAAAGGFLDTPADPGPTATPVPPDDAPTAPPGVTASSDAAGTVLAGRYTLAGLVGEGGMGSVWMAHQTEPVKRPVAVKLIKAGMDTKAVLARFEAERQALAIMDHPHIATVLDAGATPDGRPFIVMELVQGVPITRFCDDRKLTPRERLELFVPVCLAIQHAHQKGVIHRDVKPSNVLVAEVDGKPVPKVIDFGVAKATGPALTEQTLHTGFGAVVGTPSYMSPEQATLNNLDVDTRTDVYSLGALLYELLAGSPPFARKDLERKGVMEVLRAIREEEPPRPSTKLSTADALPSLAADRGTDPKRLTALLRGELDWIVMKALEKDRTRRYETPTGFAADVRRYLAGEAVLAVPPSAGYRVRKFVRRNRGPVAAAGLVAAALLLGIGGTTAGLVVAREQRDAAGTARQAEAARAEGERLAKEAAERAAEAEKAARQQTQRRLAQIEKGVELFAGLLVGINPRWEEQGGPPLYQQLAGRAAQAADGLEEEAVGDPLAVARLQTTLGRTLIDLGDARKAIAVLEKARRTRERDLEADHPDTLVTLDHLADAYRHAGRLPEAVALHERVRDARVATCEADHPDTLVTLNNLATAYQHANRVPEAIALFERVRDARVAKCGADHPDTLTTLNNLALAYRIARRLPEAIALYEQVRDARVARGEADHPETLVTLGNLAEAYRHAGRLPEAIALGERVRDARVDRLGGDHPATLAALNNLALAYKAAGRLPETIALLEQVRDASVVRRGADHPDTLATLGSLADAYRAVGRLPEAIALGARVRDARVARGEADHPETLVILNNLALAYREAGRLPEALPLYEQAAAGVAKRKYAHGSVRAIITETVEAYEEAGQWDRAEEWQRRWVAVVKEKAGADSLDYAGQLAVLGFNLLEQRKWADAEATLRECLAVREKKQPTAWTTFSTRSMLGGALLGQGKHADAEPLLVAGYEGLAARAKAIPPGGGIRLAEAADRLVELYARWGKPAEAARWRAERAKYPPETAPAPRRAS